MASKNNNKDNNTVLVLDYGSQVAKLLADSARGAGVYSEIAPFNITAAEIARLRPSGLIISGGPDSVYKKGAPLSDKKFLIDMVKGSVMISSL